MRKVSKSRSLQTRCHTLVCTYYQTRLKFYEIKTISLGLSNLKIWKYAPSLTSLCTGRSFSQLNFVFLNRCFKWSIVGYHKSERNSKQEIAISNVVRFLFNPSRSSMFINNSNGLSIHNNNHRTSNMKSRC